MPVRARNKIDCELRYSLTGWSVFYKTASGSGTITCDNGQSMKVKIRAKGGGLTFGKQTITDGRPLHRAHNITRAARHLCQGGAHAGVVRVRRAPRW